MLCQTRWDPSQRKKLCTSKILINYQSKIYVSWLMGALGPLAPFPHVLQRMLTSWGCFDPPGSRPWKRPWDWEGFAGQWVASFLSAPGWAG